MFLWNSDIFTNVRTSNVTANNIFYLQILQSLQKCVHHRKPTQQSFTKLGGNAPEYHSWQDKNFITNLRPSLITHKAKFTLLHLQQTHTCASARVCAHTHKICM
jgi:hypothetical protein